MSSNSHDCSEPGRAGFRLTAEWEPQQAVWFTWPPNDRIWAGQGSAIKALFAGIIALASRYQEVRINAARELEMEVIHALRQAGADLARIQLYDHPADDVWCRDHGPLFLRHPDSGEVIVTDWVFNGWGDKFRPHDKDTAIPACIARTLGMRRFAYPHILEGGALEVNAAGILLTTTAVLLNPNRGRHDRRFWQNLLGNTLGVREIVWLGEGLPDDDTDGHIDNLARFLPDGGILCVESRDLPALQANRHVLAERFGDCVRELPLPETSGPPCSYANYVVLNQAVLMPTFAQPRLDARAAGILRESFPGRDVHGVDCRLLLLEGGALHCLSMNQPA